MKQYLEDEKVILTLLDIYRRGWHHKLEKKIPCSLDIIFCVQVEEIDEIIEMKITHRRNLERRKAKFG